LLVASRISLFLTQLRLGNLNRNNTAADDAHSASNSGRITRDSEKAAEAEAMTGITLACAGADVLTNMQ